jgi:hypothetical protein
VRAAEDEVLSPSVYVRRSPHVIEVTEEITD